MTNLLRRGTAEPLKADVHGVMEGLAVVFCAYNLCAFLWRIRDGPSWHLLANAAIYGNLAWFEDRKRRHHWTCQDKD